MPQFSDYLLAPWKFFGLLLSSSAPRPTAPGAAQQVAAEGLCYLKDVGGQVLSICQIGGYEMPAFVFWASGFIFLLFLGSSVALTQQCFAVSGVLLRVSNRLDKIKAESRALTSKELGTIRDAVRKEPMVGEVWNNFEDTLLINEEDEVYSTQPAESVFTKAAVIETNVHTTLFASIPGILTGLGLLMTFVAILDGLSHVTVTETMDVKGIGGLINGLSGKFFSSIVAVTCAVLFVFVERFAFAQPERAYRKLVHALSSKFRRRTVEHLLLRLSAQLSAQAPRRPSPPETPTRGA